MKKRIFPAVIVVSVAVIALIFLLIMPSVNFVDKQSGDLKINWSANIFGFLFGNGSGVQNVSVNQFHYTYSGGVSVFALISAICLVAGIVLVVLNVFFPGKYLNLIGSTCVFVAGISMFLILAGGSAVTMDGVKSSFKEFFDPWHIGVGVYIYSVLTIEVGIYGFFNALKNRD